jgi:hypothetical protein
MNLQTTDLMQDERVQLTKLANSVVHYTEHGLERIRSLHIGLEAIGWGGKEAIGGKLHLTNLRLVFASHRFNRLTGTFSIFLPTIVQLRNTSRAVVRRMTVTTPDQEFDFVVSGVDGFISAISDQRARATRSDVQAALESARERPQTLASGFTKSDVMDRFLRTGLSGHLGASAAQIVIDPFGLATIVNVAALWASLSESES